MAATFSDPATETAIQAASSALSQQLPKHLVALLRETDGVGGEYQTWVWNLEEIVTRNSYYRRNPDHVELYMPFEPLLFFADAGADGIPFAFLSPPVVSDNIFVWDPIEDTRSWCTDNLESWVRGWLGGRLSI
jgi:hypothetical protein